MKNFLSAKSSKEQLGGSAPMTSRPLGGKKFIYSLSMAALFGVYVLGGRYYVKSVSVVSDMSSANSTSTQTNTTSSSSLDVRGVPVITPTQAGIPTSVLPTPGAVLTPTPTPKPTSVPTPTPTPKGQYADGTYTGSRANAYYGYIQVQAVISNGKLTDIIFLEHPSDRRTSQEINNQAMPYLKQEAITAQSAQVDIISGATDTSEAFIQSLNSALSQAKNS